MPELIFVDHMTGPRFIYVFLVLWIFGGSGCVGFDPAYTPCIFNGGRVSITFIATFSDGKSSPGSLPSGGALLQGIKGRHLRSLSVIPTDATKHVYTESTLNRERHKHAVKDELWVVSEHGIILEDLRRIEAVRNALMLPRE